MADLLRRMREDERLLPQGETIKERYGKSVHEQFLVVDGLRQEFHAIVRELEDQVNEELQA